MKRRILSMLLAFALIFGTFGTVNAFAASPTNYQQGDSRWGSVVYGNWTVAESGCGILSVVNAVNYLTGNFIHPTELAEWAYNNNYYKQEKSALFTPINYRPSDGFAISKVKNPFSIKSLFYSVGQGVSEAQRFTKENGKTILFTLIALTLSFFVATFIFETAEYKRNHTGPLVIHNEDYSDIEILNNLMASFALENSIEYDENGYIYEATIEKYEKR